MEDDDGALRRGAKGAVMSRGTGVVPVGGDERDAGDEAQNDGGADPGPGMEPADPAPHHRQSVHRRRHPTMILLGTGGVNLPLPGRPDHSEAPDNEQDRPIAENVPMEIRGDSPGRLRGCSGKEDVPMLKEAYEAFPAT